MSFSEPINEINSFPSCVINNPFSYLKYKDGFIPIKDIQPITTNAAEGQGVAIEVVLTISFLYYRTEGSDIIYSEQ